MKFRHSEPITRVNYLKQVTFVQKSVVDNKQVGKGTTFNWNFPDSGALNQNNLQNVSDLDIENFQKYNEYTESLYIDGKKQDIVSFKAAEPKPSDATEEE